MRILVIVSTLAFGFLVVFIAGLWLTLTLLLAAGLELQINRSLRGRKALTEASERRWKP